MKRAKMTPILLLAVLMFMLCGCSTVNEMYQKVLWDLSGVEQDASYQQDVELRDNGQLDDRGLYQSDELKKLKGEEIKKSEGTIHVSFSVNEALGFTYYRDAAMTQPLDTNSCWLNPGDAIYVSAPDLSNAPVLYQFSRFQIRSRVSETAAWRDIGTVDTVPGLVYAIPADFKETDLSILPMGYYEKRTIILSARDGDDELTLGYWTVNGEEYGNTTLKVDAQETCQVVYHYGTFNDSYYFIGSEPECFYNKSSDGTVTFYETPSDKAEVIYTVELHPYTSLLIQNGAKEEKSLPGGLWDWVTGEDQSIFELENLVLLLELNGSRVVNKLTGEEGYLDKLKAGDELRIRVPADMKLTGSGITITKPAFLSNSREYTLTIPWESYEYRRIAVTPRNSDDTPYKAKKLNSCTLRLTDKFDNAYVDGGEQPGENETVKVTIIPDEQMCISGKNVTNNVYRNEMKYSDYLKDFSKIIGNLKIGRCGSDY